MSVAGSGAAALVDSLRLIAENLITFSLAWLLILVGQRSSLLG
jgi:hypothetical protein